MNARYLFLIGLFILAPSLRAADEAEAKMREQLRNTMLQLRTAQNEKAALEAQKIENEQKLKTLGKQVEDLTKQASEADPKFKQAW